MKVRSLALALTMLAACSNNTGPVVYTILVQRLVGPIYGPDCGGPQTPRLPPYGQRPPKVGIPLAEASRGASMSRRRSASSRYWTLSRAGLSAFPRAGSATAICHGVRQ